MRRAFCTLALLAVMQAPVSAGLTLAVEPVEQAAAPGAELLFSGTLTNTSPTDKLFLNDIQATLSGGAAVHLLLKSNTFFSNVPGILLPGETYTGPLFRVRLSPAAPATNYTAGISFHGGASIIATSALDSTTVTLLARPVDQWRYLTFGASANDPAAADTADWDHDGLENLLEYALQLDAKKADAGALPKPAWIGDHATLSYVASASDIIYSVEASSDLSGWSADDVEQVSVANPQPPGSLTFRFKHALGAAGKVFLRLRMTRVP